MPTMLLTFTPRPGSDPKKPPVVPGGGEHEHPPVAAHHVVARGLGRRRWRRWRCCLCPVVLCPVVLCVVVGGLVVAKIVPESSLTLGFVVLDGLR